MLSYQDKFCYETRKKLISDIIFVYKPGKNIDVIKRSVETL